jgi:glycerol kinase
MSLLLALDQSTSGTKAVVFDTTGRTIDQASREHRQIYPQPGWVEHDPEEIWQNTRTVIREIAARQSGIISLSITNQRETILVFDRTTGRPLHNAIVWQCLRGEPICRELREAGHEDLVASRTGLKIDTYFSAPKLAWLIREIPGLAAQLSSGAAVAGTIDTWLIHRLTGGKVFATDPTNASRTLLFDIGKLRWDDELCALFQVPPRALAEIRDCTAHFGETTVEGIFPNPLPICGVMGDSQAALFAQRCYEPGMAKATFGTGTSILLNAGDTRQSAGHGLVSALAWICQGQPAYACEGLINTSAATIAWLKNQLGILNDPTESEALALSVSNSGGVYFVPAFAGLGAPHWKPEARAAIVGLTAHSSRGHIVRAALESIAFQIRDILEVMRSETNLDLRTIHADGAPTRNALLMQMCADITRTDFVVANVPEASSLGAVFAGLLGLGIQPNLDALAALPRRTRTYRPALSSLEADKLHSGWLTAVQRVL